MRSIACVIIALLLCLSFDGYSQAKQAQKKKKGTPSAESSGNAGDTTGAAGTDNKMLGQENDKADNSSQSSGNDDYRNNRVNGNPNNRNINEGSNVQNTDSRETNESSGSAKIDSAEGTGSSTSAENTKADPNASSAPVVIQETSSSSGSPAMSSGKEGSDRDGTNNVQRAKPNMAGSDIKGVHYGKGKDSDREIREGSTRQQKQSGNTNQQGTGTRQQVTNTKNPHPTNMGAPANPTTNEKEVRNDDKPSGGMSENQKISEKKNQEQMLNDKSSDKPKEKNKKKRRH
jgi:hypothetical protein